MHALGVVGDGARHSDPNIVSCQLGHLPGLTPALVGAPESRAVGLKAALADGPLTELLQVRAGACSGGLPKCTCQAWAACGACLAEGSLKPHSPKVYFPAPPAHGWDNGHGGDGEPEGIF